MPRMISPSPMILSWLMIRPPWRAVVWLQWPSSFDDANQHDYQRYKQQDVDEPIKGVGTDHAQQPHHEQDDEQWHQHHALLIQRFHMPSRAPNRFHERERSSSAWLRL